MILSEYNHGCLFYVVIHLNWVEGGGIDGGRCQSSPQTVSKNQYPSNRVYHPYKHAIACQNRSGLETMPDHFAWHRFGCESILVCYLAYLEGHTAQQAIL